MAIDLLTRDEWWSFICGLALLALFTMCGIMFWSEATLFCAAMEIYQKWGIKLPMLYAKVMEGTASFWELVVSVLSLLWDLAWAIIKRLPWWQQAIAKLNIVRALGGPQAFTTLLGIVVGLGWLIAKLVIDWRD